MDLDLAAVDVDDLALVPVVPPVARVDGVAQRQRLSPVLARTAPWAAELDNVERAQVIRFAWQQYSTVLQSGNAEMILSATG